MSARGGWKGVLPPSFPTSQCVNHPPHGSNSTVHWWAGPAEQTEDICWSWDIIKRSMHVCSCIMGNGLVYRRGKDGSQRSDTDRRCPIWLHTHTEATLMFQLVILRLCQPADQHLMFFTSSKFPNPLTLPSKPRETDYKLSQCSFIYPKDIDQDGVECFVRVNTSHGFYKFWTRMSTCWHLNERCHLILIVNTCT